MYSKKCSYSSSKGAFSLCHAILRQYSNLPLQKKLLKLFVPIFEISQLSLEFSGSVTVIKHLLEAAAGGAL